MNNSLNVRTVHIAKKVQLYLENQTDLLVFTFTGKITKYSNYQKYSLHSRVVMYLMMTFI